MSSTWIEPTPEPSVSSTWIEPTPEPSVSSTWVDNPEETPHPQPTAEERTGEVREEEVRAVPVGNSQKPDAEEYPLTENPARAEDVQDAAQEAGRLASAELVDLWETDEYLSWRHQIPVDAVDVARPGNYQCLISYYSGDQVRVALRWLPVQILNSPYTNDEVGRLLGLSRVFDVRECLEFRA